MAAVTLKSLLLASDGRCDYDIYCVITKDTDESLCDVIRDVVRGTKSSVHFLYGNNDFDESPCENWPIAM